jgi:hypothetical protein
MTAMPAEYFNYIRVAVFRRYAQRHVAASGSIAAHGDIYPVVDLGIDIGALLLQFPEVYRRLRYLIDVSIHRRVHKYTGLSAG